MNAHCTALTCAVSCAPGVVKWAVGIHGANCNSKVDFTAFFAECHEPGEVVFREGQTGAGLYIIKQGAVDIVLRMADGGEQAVVSLGDRQFFGGARAARVVAPHRDLRGAQALGAAGPVPARPRAVARPRLQARRPRGVEPRAHDRPAPAGAVGPHARPRRRGHPAAPEPK